MKDAIGPYRTGQEVRRGACWTLYAGRDSERDDDVWVLHVEQAAESIEDVRRRALSLKQVSEALTPPSALSPDRPHLISITRAEGYVPIAQQAPRDRAAAVRVVETAVHAVTLLHASGQAHGALDGWLIDVDADGLVRLRGAAELARTGNEAAYREDIRTLARSLRAHLPDAALPTALDSALRDASRSGDSHALQVAAVRAAASVDDEVAAQLGPTDSAEPDAVLDDDSLERDHHPERDLLASLRSGKPDASTERRHTPAAPVLPDRRGTGPRHARHASAPARVDRRRIGPLVPIAAALLSALLAIAWLTSGEDRGLTASGSRTAASTAGSPSTTSDAVIEQRLHELYAARAAAITDRDRYALQAVYAPGATMLAQDESLIAQLAADGSQVDGFDLELLEVGEVQIAGATAQVSASDRIPPFEIVAVDGARTTVNGRPEAAVTITLVMTESGWLIQAAERE